jgi:hypothetical protein
MEKELKVITTYSKTLADFYSLWSLITSNFADLPAPKELVSPAT